MCGITGWYTWSGADRTSERIERRVLKKMNDRIAHRGPDSDGIMIDDNCGLAMRRLAIIDLSPKGNQPMTSTTGNSTIVFNGEIYNYQELRNMRELKSYQFKSSTDTEIILALYECFGERCISYLRGMFAFAIYDHRTKDLLVARDRLGKKPLFYLYNKGLLLFCSEIKGLLEHPALEKRTLNEQSVHHYLRFGWVGHPQTIFNEIKKLPGGHMLRIAKDGSLRITKYWDLDFNEKLHLSYSDAEKRVKELVEESVRLRMIADVPLGAFLSGGIDSSIVVACMAKHSPVPIKTFSVGFDQERYNELAYARIVAEKYGTNHKEIMIAPDFVKDAKKIIACFDEPFADASSIPTWYIAKETRRHVSVALNGDGGDENFAGYTRYSNLLRARFIRLLPLPKKDLPRTGAARMFELLGMKNEDRFQQLHTMNEPSHVLKTTAEASDSLMGKYYAEPKTLLDKWLYTDIKTYLQDDLLVKVDIATMANSLESRSPLLDQELLSFTARLPSNWKAKGDKTKIIFKDAFKDVLPQKIIEKKKQGFAVPMNEWMRGELGDQAQDDLLSSPTESQVLSMLDKEKIARMFALHKSGTPNGYRLWNLFVLREWEKNYLQ